MDSLANSVRETCFHCHGRLPATPINIDLADEQLQVCSENCATTVEKIYAGGLRDFYKHREEPGTTKTSQTKTGPKTETNWETYERPAVMREFVRSRDDGTQIADLLIQGVHCAACTWLIENTLNKITGVIGIEVNPVTTRAELQWQPGNVRLAALLSEIDKLGYMPTPFTEQEQYLVTEQERRLALRRLLVAGLGMMQVASYAVALYAGAFQGMDASVQEFLRLVSLIVATPVVLYSGAPFFAGAWRNLRGRSMGMDVPVAIAIGAAWSASVWNTFAGTGEVYFDSATMFVFFLSGTRYLEAAGRGRALELTNALAQNLPCTAIRITPSGTQEIGVMELEPGDRVRVLPGMAFPADGLLEKGHTHVDESMLTGESRPLARGPGDAVVAGTVNLSTTTTVQLEKTGADTVLAQIGRLVTLAGTAKPRLVQITDRIASVFVGAILILATGATIGWYIVDADRTFEIVLTVLVVSCPCALALATPAAFTVATSTLARHGFLIRHAGALQTLADVNHVVFDKTGTLTENALEIGNVELLGDLSIEDIESIAAALEAHSSHPIARAFRTDISQQHADEVNNVPGCGLEGRVNGARYRIGTKVFAAELGKAERAKTETDENETTRCIWLGGEQGLLAKFTLSEELRAGARDVINKLNEQAIVSSIASGDRPGPVAALAKDVGAANWTAAMLPEDKLQFVQKLQNEGNVVAVVGDGVNDAPVLAGASVSIAMGSGTSMAQHSADCVWMGNDLKGLNTAFGLAQRTMRIVRQNLAWALCYNILAIPLAISGSIAPWMAALGMSLSSLLVMLNALRLGRAEQNSDTIEAAESACCSKRPELAT